MFEMAILVKGKDSGLRLGTLASGAGYYLNEEEKSLTQKPPQQLLGQKATVMSSRNGYIPSPPAQLPLVQLLGGGQQDSCSSRAGQKLEGGKQNVSNAS